ncbi:hypothetical protein KCV03_g277, partial [Aureobasidium melanogenum]
MSTSLQIYSDGAPKNGKRRIPDFTGPHRVVCEPCHASKLKCDRGHPCSRCIKKQVECIYAPPPVRKKHSTGPDWRAILDIVEPPVTKTWSEYQSRAGLKGLLLLLTGSQKYSPGTGSPPFIHPSQLQNSEYPPPLARCATIAHMWANQTSDGGDIVREAILREAQALFESDGLNSSNDMERLVSMQAYLLLCLMLLPSCTTEPMMVPQEMKINLQELTAKSAREGLICPAEQTGSRPDYLSWILAEAKRRTLYAVYMVDDVINTLGNMPCVLGDDTYVWKSYGSILLTSRRGGEEKGGLLLSMSLD